MAAKTLSRESLSAQIYGNLRRSLMDGSFSPGQRLTISGVANEYGVSITPVREAIFRLVSERALEMRAATSVQVPKLSPDSIREVQSIRIQLEGTAAERAAKFITSEQLEELEMLNERFIAAAAANPKDASLLNRDFHFAVIHIAAMPILESICENMWVLMGPFLRLFHDRMPTRQISSSNHKHFELLAGLKARDGDRCRVAMQDDVLWGREMLELLEADEDVTRFLDGTNGNGVPEQGHDG